MYKSELEIEYLHDYLKKNFQFGSVNFLSLKINAVEFFPPACRYVSQLVGVNEIRPV